VAGVIGFGAAMTALLVFLLSLPHPDWIALVVLAAAAAALIAWEIRAANPFLDVRLLAANRVLTRTYLRNGLTLLGVYVILYGLTQWVEVAHGLSPYQAGLALIPMGVFSAISARVAANHVRLRRSLTGSALLLITGAVSTLFLTSHSPLAAIIAVTAVFGLGSGSSTVTNQTALYHAAPPQTVGTASGLLRTFGYLGSIASATITGLVFHTHVTDTGLHRISLILIPIGILVLLLTALDRGLGRSPAAADPAARPVEPTRRPQPLRPVREPHLKEQSA
jgi:MFS family permease